MCHMQWNNCRVGLPYRSGAGPGGVRVPPAWNPVQRSQLRQGVRADITAAIATTTAVGTLHCERGVISFVFHFSMHTDTFMPR
jgi:hypothetical protein